MVTRTSEDPRALCTWLRRKQAPACPRLLPCTMANFPGPCFARGMRPSSLHTSIRQPSATLKHPLGKVLRKSVRWNRSPTPARASARLAFHSSTDRLLECEHLSSCSGCTQVLVTQPPIFSDAKEFFRSVGYREEVQLIAGPQHGWRCRARLAVRGEARNVNIGLFRAGSHNIVDIPRCSIHHPRINVALEAIRLAVNDLGIPPYDESSGRGKLRYVQVTAAGTDPVAAKANLDPYAQVQVVLVWNGNGTDCLLQNLVSALSQSDRSAVKPLFHSIWANFNTMKTNTILGHIFQRLDGSPWLWQDFGGARACFAPGSFIQANFGAMDRALLDIQEAVPTGACVADLHAGVGVIGLSLAATRGCKAVRCIEISPHGQHAFEQAHAALERSLGELVAMEYIVAPAESRPDAFLQGVEVCIVDPPKKGLEPALLAALCQPKEGRAGLQKLVYLSCGFPAFKRDCVALLESDRWVLKSATCLLFFPGTDTIEMLATFERKS